MGGTPHVQGDITEYLLFHFFTFFFSFSLRVMHCSRSHWCTSASVGKARAGHKYGRLTATLGNSGGCKRLQMQSRLVLAFCRTSQAIKHKRWKDFLRSRFFLPLSSSHNRPSHSLNLAERENGRGRISLHPPPFPIARRLASSRQTQKERKKRGTIGIGRRLERRPDKPIGLIRLSIVDMA